MEAGDRQPCASPPVAAATLPPIAARVLSTPSSLLASLFVALLGGRCCLPLINYSIDFNLRDVMISAVGLWAAAMSVVRQVGGALISGEN